MSVIITYNWLEPGEWPSVTECLQHKAEIDEELSDIHALGEGVILFEDKPGQEFGFEPSNICRLIPWITEACFELVSSCSIINVCYGYIAVECIDGKVHIYALETGAGGSVEWYPFWGKPISGGGTDKKHAFAHKLPISMQSGEASSLPGRINYEFTMPVRDFLMGILSLGKQFQQLVTEARPFLEKNPENFSNPDDKKKTELAFHFCDTFNEAELRERIECFLKEYKE